MELTNLVSFRMVVAAIAAVFFVLAVALPTALAQSPAPAPSTSDGTSIDQGVAYVLMLVALALTYLIH